MRKSKQPFFYGWWIVVGSVIAYILSGGFYFYGFSTMFMPLTEEFGWSRAATSGAFSFARLEGGLLGPIGGFLVDKLGPRKIMFFGILMMGTGYLLLSRINSLLAFYLTFVLLIAIGATVGIHQAPMVSLANWFVKKRGTAIGIGLSGIGLGGLILPFLAWLISQYGWRQAAIVTGLIVWAVGIPTSFLMRRRPEHYGLLPDGAVSTAEALPQNGEPNAIKAGQKEVLPTQDFAVRQALRTSAFWLLAAVFALRHFVVGAIAVHEIPFLIDVGISPQLAATMLGSIALVSILGRLGFGRLADIIDKRHVMAVCMGLLAVACFILASAQTWLYLVIFVIVYSPGYGGGAILMNDLRGEFFGRRNFGTIMGFMDMVQIAGVVAGPVFAGWIFDVTGSYRLAFMTFAFVALVSTVLILITRRPVLQPVTLTGKEPAV
ncbi:MAG: MFS transporter [Chloroflexota bacterium]